MLTLVGVGVAVVCCLTLTLPRMFFANYDNGPTPMSKEFPVSEHGAYLAFVSQRLKLGALTCARCMSGMQGSTMGSLIKEIGWTKLFLNGLPLRIVMVGTLTGLQWGIYDAYKACAPNLAMSSC